MKRITIIGRSGSGKSLLAHHIGKILNRPVIHLDILFWSKNWKRNFETRQDWIDFVSSLTKEEDWIIDGNYYISTLEMRLDRADMIIFLDTPLLVCLFRALKRYFKKEKIEDRHEGMKEKLRFNFLRFLITYPRKNIKNKVESYSKEKDVFIIRNEADIKRFLAELKSRSYSK